MTTFIPIISLLFLAGMAKAYSDALADEHIKSSEWKRKYDLTKPVGKEWWYLGLYKPANAEKFPLSTTVLVFLTDRWHLSQFIMLRCFYTIIAITLFQKLWIILFVIFIAFPIITGLGFEFFYQPFRNYLRKNK